MRQGKLDDATNARYRLSRPGCEELLRYAIDCLAIEGTSGLSPRDRARLASAAAVLKEISEDVAREDVAREDLGDADRKLASRQSVTEV